MATDPIITLNPQAMELPAEMQAQALACQNMITGMRVTNVQSKDDAIGLQKEIRSRIKALHEFFTSLKRPIDAAKQVVLDKEKASIRPYEAADQHLDREVTNFRREEQRMAEEKRKAEEEIRFKEIEANRKREAEEARRKGKEKLAQAIEKAPIDTQIGRA